MAKMSTYQNGFAGGVISRGVPMVQMHPGKVFWVGNNAVKLVGEIGASDNNDGSFFKPFSTLDYAIGRCAADRGDVIYIRPGYTQTMTTGTDVVADVAGVSIIGLGRGAQRAKFTYTVAAGLFTISAANVHIENLWFVPSVTAVTKAVLVTAAGDDYEIVGCRFADAVTAGTDEFNRTIMQAITVKRGLIRDCYLDAGEAGAIIGIEIATPEQVRIEDNIIVGDYSTACIANITAAGTAMHVHRNIIINGVKSGLNTVAAIVNVSTNELILSDNYIASDVATFALMITNFDAGFNLGNRYTDDIGGATTAVDRSASVVVSADG